MSVGHSFCCRRIDTVLDRKVCESSTGGYRLPNDHVAPRERQTIRTNTDFHSMQVHGPVVTTLHIVLARPDEFDWSAAQTFRDRCCFALYVRVSHCAPAKTATGHLSVKRDLIRFQSKHFRNRHLIDRLKLRTRPHLGPIAVESYGCVQWFHRRVRKKRKLILGNDPVSRGYLVQRFLIAVGRRQHCRECDASCLYLVHNSALSAVSTPVRSHSIFSRLRACFAGQNLSATTATPVPFASGISKTSRTPSTARASLSTTLLTRAPKTGG